MSPAIQTLPIDVINQIAAGEVISSPAAVVRELVENALDAGATRITISLLPASWRLQVADNGCGMSLSNLRVCTRAHSTSKIQERADLQKILTLGFRGEALHSLVQLAQVEICSRPGDRLGWRIVYDRCGQPQVEERVAIAPGTIVTVADLFANFPVRRQGLPSLSQQLKAIQQTIYQMALCHPYVTWQVRQDNRLWLKLAPGDSARQILPQILKQVQLGDLHLLDKEVATPVANGGHSQLELVIGLPDRCHRRRPDWIKVALNGRCVRLPELEQAVVGAFIKTLPKDRYPVCWIHLKTCPSQIDWNCHPAKAEIYLHSLDYWQQQVKEAIAEALGFNRARLTSIRDNGRVRELLKVSEEKGAYHLNRDLQSTSKNSGELALLELKAIAQTRNTYILAEHPSGIWLIEQHIAHERVLYEQLEDCWELVACDPIVVDELSEAQLEQLQRLGIEVDPFGEKMWAVRSIPAMIKERSAAPELPLGDWPPATGFANRANAIIELSLGEDLPTAMAATACRSAIRNGTQLSLQQMQTLLDEWKRTRNPRTCPHGRPIFLSLEESSLSRFFRRHWVIGKSHGI